MRCLAVFCLFLLAGAASAANTPTTVPSAPPGGPLCDAAPAPDLTRRAGPNPLQFSLSAAAENHKDAFYKDLARISGPAEQAQAPAIVMREISDQSMRMQAGAGLSVDIPNDYAAMALVIRNRTELAAAFPDGSGERRRWGDRELDADSFAGPEGGNILSNGSATTEAGLALNRAFGAGQGAYLFDAGLIAQRVDLYQYHLPINPSYRNLFTAENPLHERQGINFNAGLSKSFGDLDMALNVVNLFPSDADEASANLYRREARASLATALDCDGATALLKLDWNARDAFDAAADQRYATAGMTFAPRHDRPRVNFGYRHDLIGNLGSITSLGLGFSPLQALELNIAGTKGEGDAYGVMARLGLRL